MDSPHILENKLGVRTVVGENILEVCYVYFDLNFTSISTSTLRLCYVYFYLNFTSISIQLYVYFDLNFTSISN